MRHRFKRAPILILLLGVAGAATVGSQARAQGYGPYLQVSKSEAGFTVEAEEATLPQVLTALGEKAGFAVDDSAAERTPIPLFEVHDATLESTLRRLLGTSNHLIVYRTGEQGQIEDGTIEKIVLLSPAKREPAADRSVSSLAGPGAVAPTPHPAQDEARDMPALADPAAGYEDPEADGLEYDDSFQDAGTQAMDGQDAGTQAMDDQDAGTQAMDDQDAGTQAMDYQDAGTQAMDGQYAGTQPTGEVDQLGVDPTVAAGEPGVAPSMPPGVPADDPSYASGGTRLPPPRYAAPID